MMKAPRFSIVIATYNRKDVVVQTLRRLQSLEIPRDQFEIIVVDNASDDGTSDAVSGLADRVEILGENLGSCAKQVGVDQSKTEFVLFLDDDSHPETESISRALDHFRIRPRLGAAGFRIQTPSGGSESSALPGVFHGCAVLFRSVALREVGGLDVSFFMQAEEYDLAFRIVHAGWGCRCFDDLIAVHMKSPAARRSERTAYLDARNNLRLIARYLLSGMAGMYREDWSQRYTMLAQRDGQEAAALRGIKEGDRLARSERRTYAKFRLSPVLFEYFFRHAFVRARMSELARSGNRTIIIAGFPKNILPFYLAADHAGISIKCIADSKLGGFQYQYRGIPIVAPEKQEALQYADGIVIADMAAPFADEIQQRLSRQTEIPIHNWFGLHAAAF